MSEDPRVSYDTPYHNVRPDVKYVGDEACAQCHVTHAESFRHHPMGRSLAPMASVAAEERLEKAAGNPFEKLGAQFLVERCGEHFFHKAFRRDAQGGTFWEFDAEVQFALGSGTNGRSYLINRDGYLYQSPISWFGQKQTWDVSPGFARFYPRQRQIAVDCLFCHSNHVQPVEHSLNYYREPIFQGYSIGCERCHGPGELHVQGRTRGDAGDPDYTIVNPRRLETNLRDAVCEQCHLQAETRIVRRGRQPFDYRPGLPLHLFLSVFSRIPAFNEAHKAVGQVEQMYESRCYSASKGKMGCISCHDPHKLPDAGKVVAYYRNQCMNCHQDKPCTLPAAVRKQKQADDSCIACHMPRASSSDIVHTAVTDHRILRQPKPEETAPPPRLAPGAMPIAHFHHSLVDAEDKDVARDLGLALTQLARYHSVTQVQLGKLALPNLEKAVEAWPDDVPALEALGYALWTQGRTKEALATYEAALQWAPEREQALLDAATIHEQFSQWEQAIETWRRVIVVNPWTADNHYRLSRLLAQREEWKEAIAECRKATQLSPAVVEPHVLLINCYLGTGEKDKARAEFAAIETLKPAELEVLRRWFTEKIN